MKDFILGASMGMAMFLLSFGVFLVAFNLIGY